MTLQTPLYGSFGRRIAITSDNRVESIVVKPQNKISSTTTLLIQITAWLSGCDDEAHNMVQWAARDESIVADVLVIDHEGGLPILIVATLIAIGSVQ